MNSKARQSDVDDLRANKTNKTDTENQMKAIDILHRQNHHLIILIIEIVKQMINDVSLTSAEKKR